MNASIFERTTIGDVLRAIAVEPPVTNRLIGCPLHADGTPSFRAFERGFRCFGCGAHGGVADFIIALGFASDRAEAARWAECRR
jgi:DNA primase